MALLRASKKPPNCQRAARWVWSVGSMARLQICRFHMLVSYRPWIAVPLRGLGKPQQSKYLGPPWDQTKKTSRSTVLKRPPLFLKKSVISQRPNTWAAICGRCTLVIATWPPQKKTHPDGQKFQNCMDATDQRVRYLFWMKGCISLTLHLHHQHLGMKDDDRDNNTWSIQSWPIPWNIMKPRWFSPNIPPFCPRTSWKKSCEDKHSRPRHTWRPKERGNQNEKHMTKGFTWSTWSPKKKKNCSKRWTANGPIKNPATKNTETCSNDTPKLRPNSAPQRPGKIGRFMFTVFRWGDGRYFKF